MKLEDAFSAITNIEKSADKGKEDIVLFVKANFSKPQSFYNQNV